MAITLSNQKLAVEFIIWCISIQRNPFAEELYDLLDDFANEAFNSKLNNRRKATIKDLVFRYHRDLLLQLVEWTSGSKDAVANHAPKEYNLSMVGNKRPKL